MNNPTKSEIKQDLKKNWSREQIQNWLMSNDTNGAYSDEECMLDWGRVMTKKELIKSAVKQMYENYQ